MHKSIYILFLATFSLFLLTQCQETATTKEAVTESIPKVEEKKVEKAAPIEVKQEEIVSPKMVETKVAEKEEPAVAPAKKVVAKAEESVARKQKPAPVKKKRAKIEFGETTHKFGTIKTGDKVQHKFKFKNTGNAPLVIKNVDVSCGCTFPSYPFLPIKPGEEGEIDVTFDSKNKVGRQKPTITVVTNGRPRTLKLHLEGFVE